MIISRNLAPQPSVNPAFDPLKSPGENAAKHAGYVIDLAKKLADGKRAGILATVDEHGMPHMRWMATISLQDFPMLYTITSPKSRKLQHIIAHPNVSWMFTNDEMSVIVNIRGKARITDDFGKMQHVWKMLKDKTKAYFLNIATEGPGFAVIETEIEDIDAVVPKYDIEFHAQGVKLATAADEPEGG